MPDSYEGPIRIMGGDGILLTTGQTVLEFDDDKGNWTGIVQTLRGSAVAGKALVVELEIPGGGRGRAQLTPLREIDDHAQSTVTGFGTPPFASAEAASRTP